MEVGRSCPHRVHPWVKLSLCAPWHLQDIANTNFVWCMAYKRMLGEGVV